MRTDLTLLLLSRIVSVPTSKRPILLKLVPVFSINLQLWQYLFVSNPVFRIRIRIILGNWIRIRVKIRIQIRIKVKKFGGGSKRGPYRVCRQMVADLHHFDEKQDPDPDPDRIKVRVGFRWESRSASSENEDPHQDDTDPPHCTFISLHYP